MEEMRSEFTILVGKQKRKDHLEDLGEDGWLILELILEKRCWQMWTGFIWLRIGASGKLLGTR